jgi:hypothetical protein
MHSINDVAKAAGMNPQDLRALVRTGVIDAERVGGQWVLDDSAKDSAIEYGKRRKRRKNNKGR